VSETNVKGASSLKPQQARALIHLAFLGGSIAKVGDLKPKLEAKPRRELETRGMLAVGPKTRKGTPVTLQDAGWRWVMENLTAELPPGEKLAGAVLARLAEFLKVNNLDVQDLIPAKRIAHAPDKPVSRNDSPEQELVRVALELGGGRITEQIRLRDLRPRMEELGYTREAVDKAIKDLQLEGILSVISINLPTDINDLDRAATIEIAGVQRHAVIVRRRPSNESIPR